MKRLEVILGTTNAKKREELRRHLSQLPVELLPYPEDIPPAPEEGSSFRENAVAKAIYLARATGKLVIGEDSGLEVDALEGRPGIFSARYAGEEATDEENNLKLLRELKNISQEQRTARYRCVIVLADADGPLLEAQGTVEGIIAETPRGRHGFGYDPLFIYLPENGTFGELGPSVKEKVSHRAKALEEFSQKLAEFLKPAPARE